MGNMCLVHLHLVHLGLRVISAFTQPQSIGLPTLTLTLTLNRTQTNPAVIGRTN